MGSEEMKHKTNAEYVTLLSFFDSTPSDLKKILQEQPIQHTDDNESRSLIFPTTVDSRLADTSLLRPPDNADNNQPSISGHKWLKQTPATTELSLLRDCGHFPAPKRDISLVFSLAIVDSWVLRLKSWHT